MRTLRVLAILTKRQLIDDRLYLVPAVIFSLVFVPAAVVAVLTDEFTGPSIHTVAVFVTLPILICLGSCALGIAQTHADRVSGVSGLLSVLPVARLQVLAVRILVGVSVILIALLPLVLTSAILWQIMGPPAWLVRDWRADVFSGMLLAAFTSYGLGLSAGTRARTFLQALAVMPLAFLLVLLIVAKGFGWPLLSILVFILIALILESVRSRLPPRVAVGVVGLLALVFAAMLFFWGRFLSDAALSRSLSRASSRSRLRTITLSPCGLLAEKESASDDASRSRVRVEWIDWRFGGDRLLYNLRQRYEFLDTLCSAWMGSEHVLGKLGIAEFLRAAKRGYCYVDNAGRDGPDYVHLNCADGLLTCHREHCRGRTLVFPLDWRQAVEWHAGPNGVSRLGVGDLGRFASPLMGVSEFVDEDAWGIRRHELGPFMLYEAQSRCFFSIDLEERLVSHGPAQKPHLDTPVQIGTVPRRNIVCIRLSPPRGARGAPEVDFAESPYVPVICESGRIGLLDRDKLEIIGSAGALPRPRTLFGWGSQKPADLLATDVVLVAVGAARPNDATSRPERGEYVGAVAASVSRQGTSMNVAIFDRQGKLVKNGQEEGRQPREYMISKYFFESLHPPVLTLASFFTAYSFEAGATHRALFLMPNSFAALQRDRETSLVLQFLSALLFLSPALVISGFLSRRVVHDAAVMDMPRRARRLWGLGTFAFGLPAYVTYRLTRPRVALALCSNCGGGRRVDMEVCHHCGSGWDVPVLEPPAWRVTSESGPSPTTSR
jgi:hypothetical protein